MVEVDARIATRDIRRAFAGVSGKVIAMAMVRAMNRTIDSGVTAIGREIRGTYAISSAGAIRSMKKERASSRKMRAAILASTRRNSLADFRPIAKQAFGARARAISGNGGETVRVVKGQYRSRVVKRVKGGRGGIIVEVLKGKKELIPGAFFLPNGKYVGLPFARGRYDRAYRFEYRNRRVKKAGDDTPIEGLSTLSVYVAAVNDAVQRRTASTLMPKFRDRFRHEMNYLIGKQSAGK